MQSQVTKTASTWDSFADTLRKVLDIIHPVNILEYGPGVSTKIMSSFPSVQIIDSIENDEAWCEKYRWEVPDNVIIHYQPVLELYPEEKGRIDKYDLIFIDGREREHCLYVSRDRLTDRGVVMLHDAERTQYKEMINTFKFKFFTDDGHTVTLTDNSVTAMRLERLYEENSNPST